MKHEECIEVAPSSSSRFELSERESQLLQFLANNAERVVSRDEILLRVWGLDPKRILTRVVDMHIAHLRVKLNNPGAIRTLYGQGYMFTTETH